MFDFPSSELKKLSEESLTRQPEEVFDIICKLGEGSYGSVYKALHKESEQVSLFFCFKFLQKKSKFFTVTHQLFRDLSSLSPQDRNIF